MNHKSEHSASTHSAIHGHQNVPSSDNEEIDASEIRLLPTPSEIVGMLSKRVIGHEKAKRDLATAAYNHFLNCAKHEVEGTPLSVADQNTLIAGPSGCGKSLLLKTLGQVLRVPVIHIPCTNVSPNGYKGMDLTQWISRISRRLVDVDDARTQPAIVVLDEVDKLRDDGSLQGSYRRTTQQDFLTYLDGALCGDDSEMDAAQILNIACGAFVGLDEIRQASVKRPVIGFRPHVEEPNSGNHTQGLPQLCPDDLIRFGFIPEFVGRFANITALDSLDGGTMRRILCEAEDNILARKKNLFDLHGIGLELTDDAISEVVAMALKNATGARSLRLILDKLFKEMEYRLPELAQLGVTSLVYDRETVRGTASPTQRIGSEFRPLADLLRARQKAGSYADWKMKPRESEKTDSP